LRLAGLTARIRSRAKYDTSLNVLQFIVKNGKRAKSGFMLGLGELEEEITETMHDILETGCTILTVGQYLQPGFNHMPVQMYVTPEKFAWYKDIALSMGFKIVESNPLVRSSFHAEKHIIPG
jgi:lipoic acid synthetase